MKKILSVGLISLSLFAYSASFVEAKPRVQKSYVAPMALCKDGTYSYSANHQGTCSHHKGVRVWYR